MEQLNTQLSIKRDVKTISWILIILSTLAFLRILFFTHGYNTMITLVEMTKNFVPSVEINFTLYFVQQTVELLLWVVILISSVFVLKYNNLWRRVLIYSLSISIIYLLVSPLINYFNFEVMTELEKSSILIWSYVWSGVYIIFFIFAVVKLSNKEVKSLFIKL